MKKYSLFLICLAAILIVGCSQNVLLEKSSQSKAMSNSKIQGQRYMDSCSCFLKDINSIDVLHGGMDKAVASMNRWLPRADSVIVQNSNGGYKVFGIYTCFHNKNQKVVCSSFIKQHEYTPEELKLLRTSSWQYNLVTPTNEVLTLAYKIINNKPSR